MIGAGDDEARSVGAAGPQGSGDDDSILSADPAEFKALADRLEARGYRVQVVHGAAVVSRWGLVSIVGTMAELRALALRAGCVQ